MAFRDSDHFDTCVQIGRYFWVMLTELLKLVWEPEKQNERLIVMTTNLFGWGIRCVRYATTQYDCAYFHVNACVV